jgi:NAD(P)-dependent dehydrogenase (short-subunit alcohol dehydrogenase family)
MRLKNKVAIVTGGGAGLGKAISLALAGEGAAVVVTSRTMASLETAVKEIRLKEGCATAIQTDIANEEQVRNLVGQTLKEYGQIDILVNNAAITGPTANVVDIKLDDWNKELAVGLTGTMICSREVLKSMIPRKSGNIINISSSAGTRGYPMRSAYCVIKWGLTGFTQTLALEVGEFNIRVNAIAPAWLGGERLERAVRTRAEALGQSYEEIYQNMIGGAASRAALGRLVTPEEAASTALFLASDESSGITGQTIIVDAGRSIRP